MPDLTCFWLLKVRLGTGGLWGQDGPETEAGDQGPAAPDQRESMAEGADGGAVLKELMELCMKALPGRGAGGGPCLVGTVCPWDQDSDEESCWRSRDAGGAETLEEAETRGA
ncbi:unnamed protein product [Boreogadus saida]